MTCLLREAQVLTDFGIACLVTEQEELKRVVPWHELTFGMSKTATDLSIAVGQRSSLCKNLPGLGAAQVGTVGYAAPEMLAGTATSFEADVAWSN